jgi:methylenetetrahydrofolate--tRNA-(uracil-5-)-methyltransferase
LCHYITHADPGRYQPANITFDLLPHLDEERRKRFRRDRKARHAEVCRDATAALEAHLGIQASVAATATPSEGAA